MRLSLTMPSSAPPARRISARQRAASSAGSNGLDRKSSAPMSSALTLSASVQRAVSMSVGMATAGAAQPAHQREPVGAGQSHIDHREREFLGLDGGARRLGARHAHAPRIRRPTVRERSRRRRCRRPRRSGVACGADPRAASEATTCPRLRAGARRRSRIVVAAERRCAAAGSRRAASPHKPWRRSRCRHAGIRRPAAA